MAALAARMASVRPLNARGPPGDRADRGVPDGGYRGPPGSVAGCSPRRPPGVTGAVKPAIGDLDQLDRTPRPLLDELVAHAGQRGDALGCEARGLVVDLVRDRKSTRLNSSHG